MSNIKLVVFDMAGTTVKDNKEVEACFIKAAESSNLPYERDEIISMMGWSKRVVFETLWKKQNLSPEVQEKRVEESYNLFKEILENHYRTEEVVPTDGCLELFAQLKERGVKIALTTGFYREVASIILDRLGWSVGLDSNFISEGDALIDLSIASDEVELGRPEPYMIQRAMNLLGITDPKEVIKVGDTPSDIEAGNRAGCAYSLGVTNGTHTKEQLELCDSSGLISTIAEVANYI